MQLSISRLLPVTATVALLLSACGSGDSPSAGQPVDTPDDTVDAGGLRAPTPIRTAGGAAGDSRLAAPEADVAAGAMIAPYRIVTEFLAGDLGALPGNTTGYVFDAGSMPTAADAARIAGALGVDGDPQLIDDGYSVSYRVGPDDGSAPSVTVWDDAMLSWNYSAAWADQVGYGCAVAGTAVAAEPAEVDPAVGETLPTDEAAPAPDESLVEPIDEPVATPIVEPVECVEPEPPSGVPSAADAEARVTGLLAALGVDAGSVEYDSYADQWSASVNVNEMIDGVIARSWGFGFGGDAELQYAYGSVATPVAVGPYDLIDLDTALERLNDGRYGWGSFSGGPDVMAVDTAAPTEGAVAEEPPVDVPEGDVIGADVAPPEPEEVTVTLVDVAPDLWWVWDVDGSAWLVPAYRFTGDDGGTYTVPAVTDEFLVEVEPTVDDPGDPGDPTPLPDEPIPVEPDGGIGDGAEPAPEVLAQLADLMPASIDEFTAAAEELGLVVRVVEVNGEPQAVTEDYNPSRVNVAVVGDGGADYVVRATTDDGTLIGETEIPGVTSVAIQTVRDGVEYYPACGDETLDVDGVTWYPLSDSSMPEVAELLDRATGVDREPFPVANGFARVVEPGPGDDIGTLVIWFDGIARWVSDSGDLDVWLTTTEITYPWVC